MKWFLSVMIVGMLLAAPAARAEKFDIKNFDAGWFCTGCVGCEEDCPCAIIANECGTPIQVGCAVKEKAEAHFKAWRKQVKCRGEVNEKDAPRAPAGQWIH